MFKSFVYGLIILSCAFVSAGPYGGPNAQKKPKPDFSGTWRLDKSKGNYVKTSGLKPEAELVLVISHSDPEIRVTRKLTWEGEERIQQLTYYADGRGETNPTLIETNGARSKTEWSGRRLVSRYSFHPRGAGRASAITINVIEEWKLSDDGRTLTQTQRTTQDASGIGGASRSGLPSEIFIPAGPSETKKVFTRVP